MTLYLFQKTCHQGNHMTHLVEPQNQKSFVLFLKQVGEIFSNFKIICYQEWSSKSFSWKKSVGQIKNKTTFWLLLSYFFPTALFFKSRLIYAANWS